MNSCVADDVRGLVSERRSQMNSEARKYLESGNLLKEKGEFDQAIASYQQALEILPNAAEVHNQLGETYLMQGKIAQAYASTQLALKSNPNFAPAYKTWGNILQSQGKIDEAMAAYNKAVQIEPQFAEAYTNIGSMLSKRGQLQEAVAYFQKAIAIKPNLAAAYWNLGNALMQLKRQEEAFICWQKAAEHAPEQFSAQAFNDMGTMLGRQHKFSEAIAYYQRAIELKPDFPMAYLNWGTVLVQQGKTNEAIAQFRQALELKPDYLEAYQQLGNALIQQEKFAGALAEYYKATQVQPQSAIAQYNFGVALLQQGKLQQAIASFQKTIELKPDYAEAYCNIGIALHQQLRQLSRMDISLFEQARTSLKKALEINPNLLSAYISLSDLIDNPYPGNQIFAPLRAAADNFIQTSSEQGKFIAAITFINTYLKSGLHQVAQQKFLEIEPQIYNADLNPTEVSCFYAKTLFNLHALRDDLAANTKLAKYIGQQYAEKILNSIPKYHQTKTTYSTPLKIGIISGNFGRHSVGWCSGDIIQELSQLTPHLYLYSTSQRQPDDLTKRFTKAAAKFYQPKIFFNEIADTQEIIEQIIQDELDVLIDLDSLTAPLQVAILHQKPAPICISWLGFDAPFIWDQNYFLSDSHTNPSGTEQQYREQLIRMPDSFVAIAGFESEPVDPKIVRKSLRIAEDQIVYLCIAPGAKINPDLIKAQIQIIKQVPDSVLIYKGHSGDAEVIQSAYQNECKTAGVGIHRIKFIPADYPEEKHRITYKIADILLDSYPFNGGTHTLEALWFNLPVVTKTGEQFFSRLGYSFLNTLAIEAGIAHNWEEYIDWGIKLGTNPDLTHKIKAQLAQSKQPEHLSPLWNPKKFAQDMYNTLEKLIK